MKKILFLLMLLTSVAFSQDANFGKNKVQYKKFVWSFIQTDHFDIYFYQDGMPIALFTAAAAESAYTSISRSFRYQINNRVPIMVYNSHNDFQQTNVISEYMEEGIGGVTELFKNRVVLPFEGSYKQFRHVIHHELVHAVINDMFYGGSIQSIISNNIRLQLPMWFNEGLAEYESMGWDTNSDMFMRDAAIHTYLPPIEYLGGYFAYRGGQSVWYYIAKKYGEPKISEILNRIKGSRSIESGFKATLGLTVSELNERWQKENKVLYWPDIAKREDPSDYATRLTNHTKDGNFYNTSPAISPQGDKIAFISDRNEYFDVFLMSTIDNKVTKIVDGQRTKNFEELHLLTPGIGWSPDGKKIALAAKSGERDAIYLVDVETQDIEKIELPLEGIFSIHWSPIGDKLAFVGNKAQQSDIYTVSLATRELQQITDDVFSDSDPVWSADGKTIYFVSDRRDHIAPVVLPAKFAMAKYDYSQLDIYSIAVSTGVMTRVTNEPNCDKTNPVPSPDGTKLLYVSDRNGINNIYERTLSTGVDRPITNSITGVYQLSLSADANKLSFSCLNEAGFDIFMLKRPFGKKIETPVLEPTEYLKRKALFTQYRPDSADTESTVEAKNMKKSDTTAVYGDSIRIDFNNYVFAEDTSRVRHIIPTSAPGANNLIVDNNVDDEGNFKVNKYKLNFTPDIIYGNAAFSTFYGVQGTTMMAFSDMLGDHQIYFLTNLLLDLKNSDYVLAYYYLPALIDYGIQGYHSARFLYLDDPFGDVSLYRFRTWGISGSASYPVDRFNRIEFGISWMNLLRENLDYTFIPTQKRSLVIPAISIVHDNTLWGYAAPSNGTRYNLSALVSPALGANSLNFQTVTVDYRTYFSLWRDYTFAIRWSGGASLGAKPQRFFIGGTEGWINREFDGGIPIENVEDYAFLSPALPLRGYNYNARNGTRFALMNYELRFPFIRYLVTGGLPLAFQNVTGAFFTDIGSSWTSEKAYRGVGTNTDGNTVTKDLLIGMGTGMRFYIFGLPLKIDVAWSYDINGFSIPKYYFSLGGDF